MPCTLPDAPNISTQVDTVNHLLFLLLFQPGGRFIQHKPNAYLRVNGRAAVARRTYVESSYATSPLRCCPSFHVQSLNCFECANTALHSECDRTLMHSRYWLLSSEAAATERVCTAEAERLLWFKDSTPALTSGYTTHRRTQHVEMLARR